MTNHYKSFKFTYKRKNKIGKLPQKFIQEEKKEEFNGTIEIFKFNTNNLEIIIITSKQQIQKLKQELQNINQEYNYIINIDVPFNSNIIEILKHSITDIDDLIIEDMITIDQRIKYETRKNLTFIIIKVPTQNYIQNITQNNLNKIYEQFSIIFYQNILIIFQEGLQNDHLDNLRKNLDKIKHNQLEFFLYYILDLTVDKYLALIENIEDNLKEIEKKIFNKENFEMELIYFLRTNIGVIKRDFFNYLELIKKLKTSLFSENMKYYLQDLIDHTQKIIDIINHLDEFVSYLMEIHFSIINIKSNEIMKLLTVINTIFVPAIFITGIYGMNFEYIPETKWKYGYFFTLFIIAIIITITIIFFKTKKYL